MTIKEAARQTGLSPDTLRFYEKSRMIPPICRNRGIRDYSEIDLRWISLARSLRDAGLSVENTAKYVGLYAEGDEKIPERLDLLIETYQKLLLQRKQVDEAIARIQPLIANCRETMETPRSTAFPDSFTDHIRPEAIRREHPDLFSSDDFNNS